MPHGMSVGGPKQEPKKAPGWYGWVLPEWMGEGTYSRHGGKQDPNATNWKQGHTPGGHNTIPELRVSASDKKSKPKEPPKPEGDGGGDQAPPPPRAPRADVTPLPTTLDEAYNSLGPRAVGNTTFGRTIGDFNNTGFYEPGTPEELEQVGNIFKYGMSEDYTTGYDKSVFSGLNSGIYKQTEGESTVPWQTPGVDLEIPGTVVPQSRPMDSTQVLRADEKSKKLLYASGKYWVQGEDGKLKPVEGSDSASARDRALAYKRGELSYGDIGGTWDTTGKTTTETPGPVSKTEPPLREDGPLWGDSPTETPTTPPTTTQKPPSTKQTPSIPFGEIPTDFGGIKLPGGIYDTGRDLAETAGGWYGREKAKEKGGNLPFIGGMIQDYGERKGREKGGEYFDQTAGKFKGLFQQ